MDLSCGPAETWQCPSGAAAPQPAAAAVSLLPALLQIALFQKAVNLIELGSSLF